MRRALPLLLLVLGLASPRDAEALETVPVLVPDKGNLQYTSFWLADAAGYFAEEGLEVQLVTPPGPQQAESFFDERKADVAVLPPPVYANLIARNAEVVLVANLLANDPIELVVRRSILEERHLRADQPLKQRLEGLRGLRLGIAPHPPTRLRVLYASVGLDADTDIEQVILHGKEQNKAFASGEVDALYAHTPFVERAILKDDAVVLVNQSAGEVPALANRQIHALGVRRSFLTLHEPTVAALVRAIAKAQKLVHDDPRKAAEQLAKMFPQRDRAEVDLVTNLYAPAIPTTPTVRADLIPGAVEMFPADKARPDLTKIALDEHVKNFTPPVNAPLGDQTWFQVLVASAAALVFVAAGVAIRVRQAKHDVPPDTDL